MYTISDRDFGISRMMSEHMIQRVYNIDQNPCRLKSIKLLHYIIFKYLNTF